MSTNPFKKIEPKENAPEHLKEELFGNLHTMSFLTQIFEHFTAIMSRVLSNTIGIIMPDSKEDEGNK